MVQTLNKLTSLAKTLNEKSDRANEIITSINQRLAELSFGLEVWHENHFVSAGDTYYQNEDEDMTGPEYFDVVLLGYYRFDDGWQLALKSGVIHRYIDAHYGSQVDEVTSSNRPTPLLKGSREERIRAMHLIPELLKQIEDLAEGVIADIDKAAEVASKL